MSTSQSSKKLLRKGAKTCDKSNKPKNTVFHNTAFIHYYYEHSFNKTITKQRSYAEVEKVSLFILFYI